MSTSTARTIPRARGSNDDTPSSAAGRHGPGVSRSGRYVRDRLWRPRQCAEPVGPRARPAARRGWAVAIDRRHLAQPDRPPLSDPVPHAGNDAKRKRSRLVEHRLDRGRAARHRRPGHQIGHAQRIWRLAQRRRAQFRLSRREPRHSALCLGASRKCRAQRSVLSSESGPIWRLRRHRLLRFAPASLFDHGEIAMERNRHRRPHPAPRPDARRLDRGAGQCGSGRGRRQRSGGDAREGRNERELVAGQELGIVHQGLERMAQRHPADQRHLRLSLPERRHPDHRADPLPHDRRLRRRTLEGRRHPGQSHLFRLVLPQ